MRKIILGIFVLIIVSLIAGPFAAGLWVQKNYNNLISFYFSEKNIHVNIIDYRRGWFSSDVTANISFDPEYLEKLFKTSTDFSAFSKITINQHIQHGPVIYFPVKNIAHFFGIAAIQNKILVSSKLAEFLLLSGMPDLKIESASFVSIFANYFNYLRISGLNISDHVNDIQAGIQNILAKIWIYPLRHRFDGEIKLSQLWLKDEDESLEIPSIKIQLDQYQDKNQFWLGDGSMKISDILLKQIGEKDIRIIDFNVEGSTDADQDFLHANRKINIKNIQFNDELFGPVDIEVNLNKFNLLAVRDVFSAYQDILENGEVYQGQLKQKMTMLLPKIVGPGTAINLDKFNVVSPDGKIIAKGTFGWAENNFISPSDLYDLVMTGQAQLNIKISKKVMKDLIQLASTIPDFVRDVAAPQKNVLMTARNELEFAMQRNEIFIDYLSSHGFISKQAEDVLGDMQKNLVSMGEYKKIVRDLFLDRQISLIVTYQLCWQYAQIEKPYQFLKNKVTYFQNIAEKQIREKFENLLKNGYVNADEKDYSAEIKWSANSFMSNGHQVK
ncbi:MAG TPA: DUF945 family protein [Gammaproteobacteria bacterium]|nr:DUF945 family protein [Gammaproteobacteria bacterium]